MEDLKILQIIPAAGWGAVYTDSNGALDPLVCFALVEMTDGDRSWREVRPMGPESRSIEFVDEATNFDRVEFSAALLQAMPAP